MDGRKLELRDQGIAGFVKVQPLRHEGTKKRNMKFKLLSKRAEFIAEKIADAKITVHNVLGPGQRLGFLIKYFSLPNSH
jgi:hypothetical protein